MSRRRASAPRAHVLLLVCALVVGLGVTGAIAFARLTEAVRRDPLEDRQLMLTRLAESAVKAGRPARAVVDVDGERVELTLGREGADVVATAKSAPLTVRVARRPSGELVRRVARE